jgi:xanthine dehydrogenase accessory factor
MDRRETERLLRALAEVRARGERAALATVVRIRGSAYRREGTRMLVRENKTYECALSGGCLEPSVAEAAQRVIATGEPIVIAYDLAEDSVFGLGIGCSGAVDIRIERVGEDAVTRAWLAALEGGVASVLATPLEGASGRLLVDESGVIAGGLSDPQLQAAVMARARDRLREREPVSGPEWMGRSEIFFEANGPAPELVIFGAGHDAAPLASLAWTLGFSVTVVDVREAFLTEARFPGARLLMADFTHLAGLLRPGPRSFLLVMNHHLERDRQSLRFGLESEAPYIGLLGPLSRLERLLADLAVEGYAPPAAALARVRSPVGLSLGAETPEEVALSILGELLAFRRGFGGGFLNRSPRSLHRALRHEEELPRR